MSAKYPVSQPDNSSLTPPIPVLCVTGPTGSGKSAAALVLAERFHGEVINADSRQVYADFPIITAQPDATDQARCPHRLYAFLPSDQSLSAGAYATHAAQEIAAVHAGGNLPILVGGTGLYLKVLLEGIAPIPPIPPELSRAWAERLQESGAPRLHALLAERDPASAARLHPNDSQRITRALEVLEATGKPLGYWHSLPLPPSPYRALNLYMDSALDTLTPRLAGRIDAMLAAGAENEARNALTRCADPSAPGWSGIGCAELFQYIHGNIDMPACRELWLKNTRAYAKRQITWFRADHAKHTFSPGDTERMAAFCSAFLAKK